MRPSPAQLAAAELAVVGPGRVTFQFGRRGFATFGQVATIPRLNPWDPGLGGLRRSAPAMSAATLSAFTAVQGLIGFGYPWVETLNQLYLLTSRPRPSTYAVGITVNGRRTSTQQLYRSTF